MTTPSAPRRRVRDEASMHPALFEERRARYIQEHSIPFQRRAFFAQLGIFAALLLIWQLPIINPIKLLVVLFHEMSHVFAAYATGGTVFGIAIDPGGAGVTLGMGGNKLLILAAGYIGSLVIGVTLYGLCAVWRASDVWLVLTVLSCTSLLMGWLNDFTALFGGGTLALMVVLGFYLRDAAKQVVIRIVGTACCLYPIIDVAGEAFGLGLDGFIIRGQVIGSDALELSRLTGVPWSVIAVVWGLGGLGLLAWLVTWSAKLEAQNCVKRELVFRKKSRETRKARIYNPNDPTTIPEYTIK